MIEHVFLRHGALPDDAAGDPEFGGQRLQFRKLLAAADMVHAPVKLGGQQRQCAQQHVVTLLTGEVSARNM